MGSQQLLLIVVGVVIVGLAVVLGFNMFEDSADKGRVDAAISYSQNLSRDAVSSLQRGEAMGGNADLASWVTGHPSGSTAIGGYTISANIGADSLLFNWALLPDGDVVNIGVGLYSGGVNVSPIQ